MKRFAFFSSMAFLMALIFSGGCRGCQKEEADRLPQCGECLELPTGEVCTVRGTMRNSCLAICVGAKILCNGACPCSTDRNR
jgi:hypothetical protein